MEEMTSGTGKAAQMAVLETHAGPVGGAGAGADLRGRGAGDGVSRRKLESRRKLMAAARKLFVERGYHDTRPQDISREAGVGHGTFYLHFEDKLDCFLAFTSDAATELEYFLAKHLGGRGALEDVIREILRGLFEYSESHPGVLAATLTDVTVLSTCDAGKKMPVTRWAEGWAVLIDRWKASGEAAADIDSALVGYLIVGAIKQSGTYASRNNASKDELVERMTRIFIRMLKANQ
jgi:AcrR family transcriptional regulator